MARYAVQRRPARSFYVEDEWCRPEPTPVSCPTVDDHVATDTGLLDIDGNAIMRLPNPIGFGRDEEW